MVTAILLGTFLGFLSGLGTGGGSLLLLYLNLVQNMQPEQARAINLLFFIPSALIASLFRWNQGSLPIKKVLPAMIAGSIASAVFSYASQGWELSLLRKAFGLFLLFFGCRQLFSPASRN